MTIAERTRDVQSKRIRLFLDAAPRYVTCDGGQRMRVKKWIVNIGNDGATKAIIDGVESKEAE